MEFKSRLVKKQKSRKDKAQKVKGMRRIKIRGRKRWVPAKSETPESAESRA